MTRGRWLLRDLLRRGSLLGNFLLCLHAATIHLVRNGQNAQSLSVLQQAAPPQVQTDSVNRDTYQPPTSKLLATFSISSSFTKLGDLIAIILGLHRTSLRLPFSLYTRPALGSISFRRTGAFVID